MQGFIDSDLKKFIETEEVTEDGSRGKLLFLHLCSVDDAGHHGGYNAPLYDITVQHANDVIKEMYELYNKSVSKEELVSTTFIVTADHGTKPQGKDLFIFYKDLRSRLFCNILNKKCHSNFA